MRIEECNPFIRASEIQPAVLEGRGLRKAYDHRLFYILSGEGMLILKNAEYRICPDTLLYFAPKTEYHFKGKLRVIVLNFDLSRACAHRTQPICPPPVDEFDESQTFDTTVFDGEDAYVFNNSTLANELLDIVYAFQKNDSYSDAITSAMLKKILAELFQTRSAGFDPQSKLIDRIKVYIRMNCSEIEGNKDVAKAFGYHPVYIATLFKESTGMTLHQAIISERVSLACRWLERTELSIEKIALNTGFSTRNHFCTVFRKLKGVSPLAYRKARTQL